MTRSDDDRAVLNRAHELAMEYLGKVAERRVAPVASADELASAFGGPLPLIGQDAVTTLDELVRIAEPGLATTSSPRFYGFVIGGDYPVATGADWLTTAWDQNGGLRSLTPALAAAREAVEGWLVDLLGLPAGTTMGTVTGGMMANFTCLTVGRSEVLRRAGWDIARDGLQGNAPKVRVIVGEDRHDTIDLSLRYLGLGEPEVVPADKEGRIRVDALADTLAGGTGPTIVALQAGNVHSGAFDDFAAAIPLAHEHGAWVHVDGAFGLWAAASPSLRHLITGHERADSWSTDAHKTLNVPYDSGLAFVADSRAHRAAMGSHGPYLIESAGTADPMELGPELSQRSRAFVLWATLRHLGRDGVAELIERLVQHAQALAIGTREIGGEVLNDVVYTQVCTVWDDDETTLAMQDRVLADGEVWMSGSTWQGRRVLRIAVSNQATTDEDVDRSLAALASAYKAVGGR